MNKLKEQLMIALSEEVKYKDINNAYNVVVDFAVSFSVFCAENTLNYKEGIWREKTLEPRFKTTEELLNKFLEEYEQ